MLGSCIDGSDSEEDTRPHKCARGALASTALGEAISESDTEGETETVGQTPSASASDSLPALDYDPRNDPAIKAIESHSSAPSLFSLFWFTSETP